MGSSTTAWQNEVRRIMKREGVSWAKAKAIRARSLGKATRPTAAKSRRSVSKVDREACESGLILTALEATQPTAIVYLVTKAEEFVNACGGDVARAQDVLRTYQNLLPKEAGIETAAAQDTRTLSAKQPNSKESSSAK